MIHYGSMAGEIACITRMENFWKDVNLGELVFGKILVPKANLISMVKVYVPTLAMQFEQGL